MIRHLPTLLGIIVASVVVYHALPVSLFAYHPIGMSVGIMVFSLSAVSSVRARKQAKTADERYVFLGGRRGCCLILALASHRFWPSSLTVRFVAGEALSSLTRCNNSLPWWVWALASGLFSPTRITLER